MTREFYCFAEMPIPPNWLLFDVLKSVDIGLRTNENIQFEKRPYADVPGHLEEYIRTKDNFNIGNKTYSRAIYRRYNISERSAEWIHKNIGSFSQCSAQLFTQGTAFYPHTDGGKRRYILNYLIKSGGPDVLTQFYQEPGFDAIRDNGQPLNILNSTHLAVIDSICIPEKSWMMLFGKVLHSVTDITESRIQLSIALSTEEFLQMKEKFDLTLQNYG